MKKDLLNTFIDLIKIDEIYGQENEVITYVTRTLNACGISVKQDKSKNLAAYIPGTGDSVMINTHLDIPESVPHLEYHIKGDIITGTGKSILGADPKSGLAVLLVLAKHIIQNKIKTSPIELVFTIGEEA